MDAGAAVWSSGEAGEGAEAVTLAAVLAGVNLGCLKGGALLLLCPCIGVFCNNFKCCRSYFFYFCLL